MPLSTRRSPLHALRRSGLFGSSGLNPFIVGEFTPHDGRYLRRYAADFVIQEYINFISRRNPAGKSYWEGYNDGPRKHSFVHVMCSGFMAYLARPATQAKLQRLQQAQDARLAAATQPTPTEAAMTNAAKETCRRMIEETQKRADIMLERLNNRR